MNILMIIGIILGGGVSVASTVGITVGIFGTIVYKFYRNNPTYTTQHRKAYTCRARQQVLYCRLRAG